MKVIISVLIIAFGFALLPFCLGSIGFKLLGLLWSLLLVFIVVKQFAARQVIKTDLIWFLWVSLAAAFLIFVFYYFPGIVRGF